MRTRSLLHCWYVCSSHYWVVPYCTITWVIGHLPGTNFHGDVLDNGVGCKRRTTCLWRNISTRLSQRRHFRCVCPPSFGESCLGISSEGVLILCVSRFSLSVALFQRISVSNAGSLTPRISHGTISQSANPSARLYKDRLGIASNTQTVLTFPDRMSVFC